MFLCMNLYSQNSIIKKRSEGKTHKVALTHIAKKLVRIIYKLESENITFKSNIN